MFSELGGIDLLSPGYDEIRIAPRPTGTIKSCSVANTAASDQTIPWRSAFETASVWVRTWSFR